MYALMRAWKRGSSQNCSTIMGGPNRSADAARPAGADATRRRPQDVSPAPYRGLLTLRGAIDRLRQLLPETFPQLQRSFSCGVVSSAGKHIVLSSGSLPEAVAASAAVPLLFCPVNIPGRDDGPFIDGGKVDRVGLEPWKQHCEEFSRPVAPLTLVHVIARSSPFSGQDGCADGPPPGAGQIKITPS